MKKYFNTMRLSVLMAGLLCSAAAFTPHTVQAQAFSDEQKKELEVMFKDYIMNNAQTIMDSVDQYRRNQEIQTKESAKDTLSSLQEYFSGKDLPSAGNPDGDVTVVEFLDYNCGYCKKAFEDVQAIIKEDSNVRFVFKEMPILSPASQIMASMALAAHKQGKYFEMHTALMDYRGPQSEDAFLELAKGIEGLDIEKLQADIVDPKIREETSNILKMAGSLGISGTPGFIIGDEIYPGYIGLEGIKGAIAKVRAAKAQ